MLVTLFPPLPEDTARAARSVFNIENLYLAIGDQLDALFDEFSWDWPSASGGKPACHVFVLAMVTLFQFAEDLPDRQAAEAVRGRMDWKYALHLSLNDPGFDPAELHEFRQRLLYDSSGQQIFQRLFIRLEKLGLLGSREKRGLDVVTALTAVDALSRLENARAGMRLAMETLAAQHPEWLRAISLPHWYERYGPNVAWPSLPGSRDQREALTQAIGADISHLLRAVAEADSPAIGGLREVQALQRLWQQEFASRQDGF